MTPLERRQTETLVTALPVLEDAFPGFAVAVMVFDPKNPRRVLVRSTTDHADVLRALSAFVERAEQR